MTRFFVNPSDIFNNTIRLNTGDISHIRSLRLKPAELFIVCDGNGTDPGKDPKEKFWTGYWKQARNFCFAYL